MNKNRYKLVFSEVRGLWVCVAEIAKSRRKSGRSQRPAKLLAAVLWLVGVLPGEVFAEMVVDPNAPKEHRPGLDTSANKTPVINITAPNSQGVSHNEFTKFDVNMPGVILNNSRADAVSTIGGYVLGNPNLNGGAARAALIEVNGQNASQINGAIEALGRNLDVIIANPNGISVNGLVTVNLNNLTLTTGVPQYLANGQLGLSVNGGQISINGAGVNTGGLSYFDLVARSVLLNAPISSADESPAAISVIAGLNDYNIDTRSLSKRSDGANNAPQWAIDGTTLGAMYGGLIRFVSTEAGIGVRHQGLVLSVADIVINADGQIELTNRIKANNDTTISGKNINIGKDAQIQGHALNLTATQELINAGLLNSATALFITSHLFSNTGQVYALGGMNLNVNDLDNNGGTLSAGTDLDIFALNQMQNRNGGGVGAQNNMRVRANTFSNAELSTLVARTGLMDLNVNKNASNAGRMIASTTLTMKVGGDLLNQKTSNGTAAVDAALIYGGTGVLLDVLGNIYNLDAASIQAASGANVELIAKDLSNSQQASIIGDTVKIKAKSLTNEQQAVIRALKENDALLDIDLSGQLSNTSGGSLLSNKDINIKAGSLDNLGEDSLIYAKGKITAEVQQGVSNADQAVLMAQEIELDAQSLDNNGATLQAGLVGNPVGQLSIDLVQSLLNRNNGLILSTGNALINAQELHNTARARLFANSADMNINEVLQNDAGVIGVNGKFTLNSKRLTNTAQEYAVENPVPGAAATERVGKINAGYADFTLTESLQNDAILDGQYLSLSAPKFSNGQTAQIRADERIDISTGDYQNLGKIDSQKWAQLTLTHDLDVIIDKQSRLPVALLGFSLLANKNVTIADEYMTPGTLEINAKGDIINQKALVSANDLVLNAGGSIINQEKALLFANGSAYLTAFERFENMFGADLLAISNITIDTTDILQRPRARIMAGKDLYMYANTITNSANYTGGIVKNNDSPSTMKEYYGDFTSSRIDYYSLFIEGMKSFSSNMQTTDQALISAGGNAYIDLFGKTSVTINGETIDITKPGDYELGGQKISFAHRGRPDSVPKVETMPQGTYVVGGRKLDLADLAKSGPQSMMVSGQTVTVVDANTIVVGQRTYNYSGVSTVELEDKQLLTMLSSQQFAVSAMNLSPAKDAQYPQTVTNPAGYSVRYSDAGKGVFTYVDPQTNQSQEAAFDKPGTYQLGNKSFMVLANGTVMLNPTLYDWSGKAAHYQIGGSEVTFDNVGKILIGGQRISFSDGKAVRYTGGGQQYTITASGTLIVGGRDLQITAKPDAPQSTANAQPQIQYSGPGTFRNEGGLVEVGGNMVLSGNLDNIAVKQTYKLIDVLKDTGKVTLKMEPNTETWSTLYDEETMDYANLYEFLDTMLVGDPDRHLGLWYYWHVDQAFRVLQEKLGRSDARTAGRDLLGQVMSTIFGSSWKGEEWSNLVQRWRDFKNATDQDAPVLSFFANNKSEITVGANFYQTDGYFRNGTEAAVPQQRKVNATIGEKEVQVVTSAPDAIVNPSTLLQGQDASKALQELNKYLVTEKKPLTEGVSITQPGEQSMGEGTEVSSIKPKTYPLYETRMAFIDQSLYFGSDYFFQKIGYRSDGTIPVLADNYLTTQALLNTVRTSIGGLMTARDGLSGPELIKHLMDNALLEGTQQRLTIGRDLTPDQISKLDKDIVWYVIEEVNGVLAMVPKVYFSQATLALYQNGPDIQRNVTAADNGGSLQAARAMVASHGAMIIDASNINNQDGAILGNKGVYASAGDDLINASTIGMNGGIWSKDGTVKLTADDQLLNRGATIQGDSVVIKAKNLTTELGVGFDSDGKQIIRNDGMITATGDKDSGVFITTDGDINLQAARIRGPNINLDSHGSINFNNLMLSDSEASSKTTGATLGFMHETLTRSSASSVGSNIQAIVLKPAASDDAAVTPSYVGGQLSVTAQNDINLIDGKYSGNMGIFNSLNGNVKTVTGQDYRYEKKTSLVKEFSVGGSASFAGYGGGASYGSVSGGKTNVMVDGKGQENSSNNASNQGANINRGGELASAQFGFSQSETEDITEGVYQNNLSLNFDSGISILASNGQVDIGGADMKTSDTGFINIKGESVVSTKYKDDVKTSHKQKDMFIGVKTEAHSSIANLVNLIDKTARDSKDKKIDPGMTTAAAVGVVTDLIFGDTIGGSTSFGVNYSETETTTHSSSENINTLRSGNISIQSTKGDISLAGVDIEAKKNLDIDAAGKFEVRAAEKKVDTSSNTFSVDASISKNYGANAFLQQTYSSDNLNVSGSYSETESSETTYTNSKLHGMNVNVKSGKDTNLTGANITGDNINVDIGGDLNVKSLQDIKRSSTWNVNAGFSVGAAAGVIGDAAPYVASTASVTAGGGKSWDNSAKVNERAGIMATNRLDGKVQGNTSLTGSTIGSTSGEGNFKTEGTTTATALQDKRDKDGFSVGGTFGFSKSGLPSATLTGSRDEQIQQESTQNAAVLLKDYQSGGGIKGELKTQKEDVTTINKNETVASTDVMLTISDPTTSKRKGPNGEEGPKLPRFAKLRETGAAKKYQDTSTPRTVVDSDAPSVPRQMAEDAAPRVVQADIHDAPLGITNETASVNPQNHADAEAHTQQANRLVDNSGIEAEQHLPGPARLSDAETNAQSHIVKPEDIHLDMDHRGVREPQEQSDTASPLPTPPDPWINLPQSLQNRMAKMLPGNADIEGSRRSSSSDTDSLLNGSVDFSLPSPARTPGAVDAAAPRRPTDALPPTPDQLGKPVDTANKPVSESEVPSRGRIEKHNGEDFLVIDNDLYNSSSDSKTLGEGERASHDSRKQSSAENAYASIDDFAQPTPDLTKVNNTKSAAPRRPTDALPSTPDQLGKPVDTANKPVSESEVPSRGRIEKHNGEDFLVIDNDLYNSSSDSKTLGEGERASHDSRQQSSAENAYASIDDFAQPRADSTKAKDTKSAPESDYSSIDDFAQPTPDLTKANNTKSAAPRRPTDALPPTPDQLGKPVDTSNSPVSESEAPSRGRIEKHNGEDFLVIDNDLYNRSSDSKRLGEGERPSQDSRQQSGAENDYASIDDFAQPKAESTKAKDTKSARESDYSSIGDFAQPKPESTKAKDTKSARESDYASIDDFAQPKPESTKAKDTKTARESDYSSIGDFAQPKPESTKAKDTKSARESDYSSIDDFAQPKPDSTKAKSTKTASESDYESLDDFAKPAAGNKTGDGQKDNVEGETPPPLPSRNLTEKSAQDLAQKQLADRLIKHFGDAENYLFNIPKLSQAETMSIGLYTGEDKYLPLNRDLRAGKELKGGLQDIDQGLQSALPKMSDGKVVKTYRGAKLTPDQSGAEGTIITDKGYLSTSKVFYTAQAYARKPASKEFTVFGSSGADVSGISMFGAMEKEILYPKNTNFNSLFVSPDAKKIVMEEAGMPKDVGKKYEQDLAGVTPKAPAAETVKPLTEKPKAKEAEDIAPAKDMDSAQENLKNLRPLTKPDTPSDLQQNNTQSTETLTPKDSGSSSDNPNKPQPDEVAERLIKHYGPKAEFIVNDPKTNPPEFLSDGEIMSIGLYSRFEYSELNIKLRNKKPLTDSEDALDKGLKSGLKKLSTDEVIKTYRGGIMPNKEQPSEGNSFTDHGYFSTSTDSEIAKNYKTGQKKLLMLFGKSGGDISLMSRFPGEKEVVYPKDTKFNQLFVAPDGMTVIAEEDGLSKGSGRKYEQDLNEQPKTSNKEDHDKDLAQRRKSLPLEKSASEGNLLESGTSLNKADGDIKNAFTPKDNTDPAQDLNISKKDSANSSSTPRSAGSSSDTPPPEKKETSAANDSEGKDKAEPSSTQKQQADKPSLAATVDAEGMKNLRSGFDNNPIWQEINKTPEQENAFNDYLQRTFASENIESAKAIDQMLKQGKPVTMDDLKSFYHNFVSEESAQQINITGLSHKLLKESLDNHDLNGALQGLGLIQKELLGNLKGSYSEFKKLPPKVEEKPKLLDPKEVSGAKTSAQKKNRG